MRKSCLNITTMTMKSLMMSMSIKLIPNAMTRIKRYQLTLCQIMPGQGQPKRASDNDKTKKKGILSQNLP